MRAIALAFLLAASVTPAMADASDVSLKTATGTLAGTLETPAKNATTPAALIIAGSGPTDRDGNGPSIHPDSYKLLARGLAEHGIATLRTDKRGTGASMAAAGPESELRLQSFADDAKVWANDLKARTGARCVWLIGHSEGALLAEMVAQDNPDICGLVLVAGPGRRFGDIIRAQLTANPANPPDLVQSAFAILKSLEAGHTVADIPPLLMPLFRPSVQPYVMSMLQADPSALLKQTTQPVLILQGDTDIQVSLENANLLAAARPDAKLVILPGVNHVLKTAPLDRAANIATYMDPSLPLGDGVVSSIAGFIAANSK